MGWGRLGWVVSFGNCLTFPACLLSSYISNNVYMFAKNQAVVCLMYMRKPKHFRHPLD